MPKSVNVIEISPKASQGMHNPIGVDIFEYLEVRQTEKSEKVYGVLNVMGVKKSVELPDLAEGWGYAKDDYDKYRQDPEKWQMARDITELKESNSRLESEIARLKSENETIAKGLAEVNAKLDTLITSQSAKPEAEKSKSQDSDADIDKENNIEPDVQTEAKQPNTSEPDETTPPENTHDAGDKTPTTASAGETPDRKS